MNKKKVPKTLTHKFSDHDCEISYTYLHHNPNYPTVVVLHALTGNSEVTGENGWWKEIIGEHKVIDTTRYNILAIDTLGNGFFTQTHEVIQNIDQLRIQDIAKINLWLLNELQLTSIHSLIGGSLGGAIAWEMWHLNPKMFQQIICIGAHPFEDHWIKATTYLQKQLLHQNEKGYEQARMWSMLFYRNALGIDEKFKNSSQSIENWLDYHGNSLKQRFSKKSYEIMNHLLGSIGKDLNKTEVLQTAKNNTTNILVVSISTDWLFHPQHQIDWVNELQQVHSNVQHHSLESIHGHDAFLIEFEKLEKILTPYL